jgi:hypothetical protein
MALKIKITIQYINDIISSIILILPSLASSPKYQVQVCKLHPDASPGSAPLHLAATIGKYPQGAISETVIDRP